MTLGKNRWGICLVLMVLGCSVVTNGKGGPPSGGNVTSIINDTDNSNPLNPLPFQVQSDGIGPYTTFSTTTGKGKNAVTDTVTSVIQGSGNWQLDTTASTTRGMKLTFIPLQGYGPPPFTLPSITHVGINDECFGPAFGGMTAVGQTTTCNTQIYFYVNGTEYILALNPSNFANTSLMQAACTGVSSKQCNAWTVTPDPATGTYNNGQFSAIAALHVAGNTSTALGYYYVAFNILVHK
jgi:hypothetical protein